MKTKAWMSSLFASLAFGNFNLFLNGEVQQINVTWNAFKCQSSCVSQIKSNLEGIAGVEKLEINSQAGSGVIIWKPNVPLSYEPFRYAAAAVGITIDSMRVRVKGTILRNGNNFFLISDGDGTTLQLIGPVASQPGRYIPLYNLASHPLSDAAIEALTRAEQNRSSVLISGPLFLPSYYPLTLIAEQIKLSKGAR